MNTLNISEMKLRALNKVSGKSYVTIDAAGARSYAKSAVKQGYELKLVNKELGIYGYEHPEGWIWLFYNIINSDKMVACHGGGSKCGLKEAINCELGGLLHIRKKCLPPAIDVRYTSNKPSDILSSQHRPFMLDVDGVHMANGVDVTMDTGVIAIRIYDYNKKYKSAIEEYFMAITGIKEVTFSRELDY